MWKEAARNCSFKSERLPWGRLIFKMEGKRLRKAIWGSSVALRELWMGYTEHYLFSELWVSNKWGNKSNEGWCVVLHLALTKQLKGKLSFWILRLWKTPEKLMLAAMWSSGHREYLRHETKEEISLGQRAVGSCLDLWLWGRGRNAVLGHVDNSKLQQQSKSERQREKEQTFSLRLGSHK